MNSTANTDSNDRVRAFKRAIHHLEDHASTDASAHPAKVGARHGTHDADPRPFVLPAERGPARWLEASWDRRHGWARRFHHQPFAQWTMLYSFVVDSGEEVVVSGEVLGLGRLRPQKRELELAHRKGPCFHAIFEGKRGVARFVPASQTNFAAWDFLSDEGVFRRVPDTEIEVFQNWGDTDAWNVWKGRLAEDARKLKRQKALRQRSVPKPADPSSGNKTEG